MKAKRYRIADIRAANTAAGNYFFARATMKFHADKVRNWSVIHRDSPDPARPSHFPHRVFIRHKVTGEVREFHPQSGGISSPMPAHEVAALSLE